MPIKIALRTTPGTSPYRRYLRELITLPTGSSDDHGIFLASPFWHTLVVHRQPPTLAELLRKNCRWIRTLADATFDNLVTQPDYCRFLKRLYSDTRADLFPSIDYRLSGSGAGNFWHAKVAIRVVDDIPIAALIGSSNLTSAPYFAPPITQRGIWNLEADVALWRDIPEANRHFLSSVRSQSEDDESLEIVARETEGGTVVGDIRIPPLKSIEHQLDWLYRRVMSYQTQPTWTI